MASRLCTWQLGMLTWTNLVGCSRLVLWQTGIKRWKWSVCCSNPELMQTPGQMLVKQLCTWLSKVAAWKLFVCCLPPELTLNWPPLVAAPGINSLSFHDFGWIWHSASQAELHFFAVSADFVHLCTMNPGSQSLRRQKGTPPEGFCHWVTLSANKPSVRKLGRKLAFPWLFQHGGISRKVIVSHCFILYCLILFGILGTEYFSKRRREISIFKFSLAAQILGQRHTSDPNKWGWRAVAFFADLDLVHILQKVGGNVIRIRI